MLISIHFFLQFTKLGCFAHEAGGGHGAVFRADDVANLPIHDEVQLVVVVVAYFAPLVFFHHMNCVEGGSVGVVLLQVICGPFLG